MKKLVGKVTEQERDQIKALFERKNGLTELFKSIDAQNEVLYNKVVTDMGKTSAEFQNWWDNMAQQYGWEGDSQSSWEIDFNDCSIYFNKTK